MRTCEAHPVLHLRQHPLQLLQERRQALPGGGGDGHGVGVLLQGEGRALLGGEAVDLVQDGDHRLLVDLQLVQGLPHRLDLLPPVGVGDVHHVQQDVGEVDLLQRGPERGDQRGGEALDEAHGVGEEGLQAVGEGDPAGGGVEGGEELVLHQHVGVREGPQEGALAGVGVAHEGHHGDGLALAPGAVELALVADLLDLLLQIGDLVADRPAVDLQLRLAGATGGDAPAPAPAAPAG